MDEIVKRLRLLEDRRSIRFDEVDERNEDDEDEEVVNSTDDAEDTEDQDSPNDTEEESEEELPPHAAAMRRSDPTRGSIMSNRSSPKSNDSSNKEEEEGESDDSSLNLDKGASVESSNPLDNRYAVNFKMGDTVSLVYSNGKSTDLEASIEGYDKEGFYRIKLANGMTINGLTDIALSSLVKGVQESACICGHTNFVREGKSLVCDECGRKIKEDMDQLSILDKFRPKGKRMIRSIPHPMSTSTRPNISDTVAENIKKALKGKKLREDDTEEGNTEDSDPYGKLERTLDNEFWTRLSELQEDIERLGYEVGEINQEYVSVTADGYDTEYLIPLGGTSRTMTLDFKRARKV